MDKEKMFSFLDGASEGYSEGYKQGRADREKEILEKVEHILYETDLKHKRNWDSQQIITWLREVIYPIEKNC